MQKTLAMQMEAARSVLRANVEGLGHDDSLVSPEPGGNCLNWVVGHLTVAYNNLLPALGGEPIWSDEQADPYKRGSEPLTADRAMPFEAVMEHFETAHEKVVERLVAAGDDVLSAPAPYSPGKKPDETVGSLAAITAFHQAYHVGQAGLLRRVCGRQGAIK